MATPDNTGTKTGPIDWRAAFQKIAGSKYLLLLAALALLLLLLPSGSGKGDSRGKDTADALLSTGVSLETEGEKLAEVLEQIKGVGRTEVLLSNHGAIVVCDGAENALVRLSVTDAVMSYTGFGSDKICVSKMKGS